MNALDAIAPALAHPISGEVIEVDDVAAIKTALADTQDYLDQPEVRRMWRARNALQARLAELEPMALPRAANQTDKQRRVERCPRCRTVLPSEPGPDVETEGDQAGVGPVAGPTPGSETSGTVGEQAVTGSAVPIGDPVPSQTELLPSGPRTPEQEAALGLTIFGERADPEPLSPPESQAQGRSEGGAKGGAPPSPPLDPIIQQAGEVEIKDPQGNVVGTVAAMVADEPNRCLAYLQNGKDERLKAAIVTYMAATRPELLEKA